MKERRKFILNVVLLLGILFLFTSCGDLLTGGIVAEGPTELPLVVVVSGAENGGGVTFYSNHGERKETERTKYPYEVRTWNSVPIGKLVGIMNAVDVVTDTVAYAVGNGGKVLKTIDNGKSWVLLPATGTRQPLKGVSFLDEQTGWVVGSNVVLRTTDGGEKWTAFSAGNKLIYGNDIFCSDAQTCLIVGQRGQIVKVFLDSLGQAAFTFQSSVTTVALNAIYCDNADNAQTCWAVGDKVKLKTKVGKSVSPTALGVILKTTNGGATWVSLADRPSNLVSSSTKFTSLREVVATDFNDVFFANAWQGWVVGDLGTILATADGGTTWSLQASETGKDLFSVVFLDEQTGYVVGGGYPAKEGSIISTLDGGQHWELAEVAISGQQVLRGVDVVR